MSVLVLAADLDLTADRVIEALAAREAVVHRVNTRWFPECLDFSARLAGERWTGVLNTSERRIDLEGVTSVLYRAPEAFAVSAQLSAPERGHAEREAKYGLGGVLASLSAVWINHPFRLADAAYKPWQLTLARRCGLATPDTMITNQPRSVTGFAAEGATVAKALGGGTLWEDGGHAFLRTRLLSENALADLRGVERTAHLIQRWASKDHEVRLVVIGDHMTAVAIHAGSEAAWIDWRSDYNALQYEVVEVPNGVVLGVQCLMEMLGLLYGTVDFVVAPDGDWTFLEVNATGLYDWLEEPTGMDFTGQLADLLTGTAS